MTHINEPANISSAAPGFAAMNLPESLKQALVSVNFTTPTPVQAAAIPLALQGRDVLASAQTGTGKTAAFMIPLLTKLINDPKAMALVMTPTRELAMQIMATVKPLLLAHPSIKNAVLIGGEAIGRQFSQLQRRPRLIVGTPGRINDHLTRGTLRLHNAHFLVLDETDRMLDMGFGIQIDAIVKFLPEVRQTLMFSATLPPSIVKMSARYLNNPERVTIGSTVKPTAQISQELIQTTEPEKYKLLTSQLEQREGSVIVFVKTKRGADRLAEKLIREKHEATAIHGDLQQRKRENVIRAFREKRSRILVATDVAARGLDIPHIEHVINYDLPQCPEDYIHRIGRTGRNGATGAAVNLITPEDKDKWRAIHRLMNPGEKQESDDRGPRRPGNRNRRPFGKPGFRGSRKNNGQKSFKGNGRSAVKRAA